jgi:hypothetical protein
MSEAAELAWAAWLGYYNRWDGRKENREQKRERSALESSLDLSHLCLIKRYDHTTAATLTSLLAPFRLLHLPTSVSLLTLSSPFPPSTPLSSPFCSQTKKLNWSQADLVQASINYATSLGEEESYQGLTACLLSPLLSMTPLSRVETV